MSYSFLSSYFQNKGNPTTLPQTSSYENGRSHMTSSSINHVSNNKPTENPSNEGKETQSDQKPPTSEGIKQFNARIGLKINSILWCASILIQN